MKLLRRHRLAHLSAQGWTQVLARPWDSEGKACIAHWAERGLPLVVTRQHELATAQEETVSLGLPAPTHWGRRRLGLQVPRSAILCFGEFPRAHEVLHLLPRDARAAWHRLATAFEMERVQVRAYGSYGWQQLTGLRYAHPGSDLDLWIAVDDARHADFVAACLQAQAPGRLRLDGELVFRDGSAVNWREWSAWRAGHSRSVLVKHVCGARLETNAFVPEDSQEMGLAA
ncbi:malonate decarboxylase holo-[acyl-carrier-protein] synthase [Variovorax sp. YR566]|uniref:malonate decarboxylase holo-[acyl-carrier-protein] synthase n=1 Tax=Variovorax sp. YR566 TaxID=3450237 RepID=UPI003F7FAB31